MCMLFGFNARRKYELTKSLKKFFWHCNQHPDGWGLCIFSNNNCYPELLKGAGPAINSSVLGSLFREGVRANLVIGHIRKMTAGERGLSNTHPFTARIRNDEWVLAHNGSVNNFRLWGNRYTPHGQTDSEKVLCYIVEQLSSLNRDTTQKEKILCIERTVEEIAVYGKLNLLISDGELLIYHTNYSGTLYQAILEDGIVLCTEPILKGLVWEKVPENRIVVYKNGELIYTGTKHMHSHGPALSHLDENKVKVFVYGTLMKGYWNHHYLEGQKYLGPARIKGYAMYQVSSFPGIIKQGQDEICGELYLVDKKTLARLDRLEDEGRLYNRVEETVYTADATHTAYVYTWLGDVKGCKRVLETPWRIGA